MHEILDQLRQHRHDHAKCEHVEHHRYVDECEGRTPRLRLLGRSGQLRGGDALNGFH
jgi:hypothetical protein